MKKNLIMGVATNYDWDALEPFVFSCKKNCPSAELVLFVDNISDFTRSQLMQWGGVVIDIPAELKGILPVNSRFKIYADFLEKNADKYEQVFVADTRDVVFQGDVFESFKNYSNFLGYTTERLLIGSDRIYNYPWIEGRFGKDEADKLADKKAICAGTILGTANELKIFCYEMWKFICQKPTINFDQGTMNYLVWNNLLPIENLIEIDTFSGAIFTNGVINDNKISDDKILRGDGGVPAVVHQYDRHAPQVQLVNEMYRDKNFQFDGRFIDTRSTIEQVTSLLRVNKIGEAAWFFSGRFLSNADFSNFGGALIKLWDMTLKKPFSRQLELLELTIQSAAKSCNNFYGYSLQSICGIIKHAEEIGHAVNFGFKKNIVNILLIIANRSLDSNKIDECFLIIDLIKSMNMPPDKNFYLFAAKANRFAGKKESALEAYKKVLELS